MKKVFYLNLRVELHLKPNTTFDVSDTTRILNAVDKVLTNSEGDEEFRVVLKKPPLKDLRVRIRGILKGLGT